MKEIILKQYIEARRVVAVKVPDDYSEMTAAELLDKMPLDNNKLPSSVRIVTPWTFIDSNGIEDENGRVLLPDGKAKEAENYG